MYKALKGDCLKTRTPKSLRMDHAQIDELRRNIQEDLRTVLGEALREAIRAIQQSTDVELEAATHGNPSPECPSFKTESTYEGEQTSGKTQAAPQCHQCPKQQDTSSMITIRQAPTFGHAHKDQF